MFTAFDALPSWDPARWGAYIVLLLVPGSLVAVVAWWLVRACRNRPAAPSSLTAERYLREATDLPDLERRMRVLERAQGGPAIVTFNH